MRTMGKRQTNAIALSKAMGRLRVLAVGIDDYDRPYGKLKTCSNDAKAVADCFLDVHQLNADKTAVSYCTSTTVPRLPTRNTIVGDLLKLAGSTSEDERLLFYFSGHGDRIQVGDREELFLVPQDAYAAEVDALLPFARVQEILGGSSARQKLIILDACFSGPDTSNFKILASKISRKALLEYVKDTKGVAVLSATTNALPATTKSPNPKLSLFTHHLVRALRGQEPDALDEERLLTVQRLYDFLSVTVPRMAYSYHMSKQQPTLEEKATGVIVLGDFSTSIVSPESLDLEGSPATHIDFEDEEQAEVADILTKIRNWSLSIDQISYAANGALDAYVGPTYGRLVPALRKALGFSQGTVSVEGKVLRFPGGSLSSRYEAENKRRGRLHRTLTIDSTWFQSPERIPILVETVGMTPETTTIRLGCAIEVATLTAGLEANQWNVLSELDDEIQAEKDGTRWTFRAETVSVTGVAPGQLFGEGADRRRAGLVGQALAVFSTVVRPDSIPRLPPKRRQP